MRLLADTHIALWAVTADPRLPIRARELMLADDNSVVVSVVSLWEIAIKSQLRRGRLEDMRLTAAEAAAEFEAAGFDLLQITVADVRDGACSSSTLKEACSWGKVDVTHEQMVFAEATTVVPLIGSDAYHRGGWKGREKRRWAKLFG